MRPHNSASKLSESQLPNLISQYPLHHDHASAILTKWGKHEGLPSLLGNPKQQLFPQEQGRPLVSSSQEAWSGSAFQTSLHEASKKAINWVPCNTQPTLFSDSEGSKQVEPSGHFENAWKRLASKHSDSDARQQSVTPISESSSRATGLDFGFGFGSFAGSKSSTPGMSQHNDISMAPMTPQKVWRKITLHSLPFNARSHNVLQTGPSKTSLATSLIDSPAQNNQNPHHGDSKVSKLPGLQGDNKSFAASLTKSNVASPTIINNNQNSTNSANTCFQQHWNIRNGQMISMSGLRTANASPTVDAAVVVKTDPSNNSLASGLHTIASNEANTQIPLYGEMKISEVIDLQRDNMSPAAASLKKSNVASSTNIKKDPTSTKNAITPFQHYGNLKSGQMISMSDLGTASVLPSVDATVLVKTIRERNSRTGRCKPRVDATMLVETPRRRDSRSRRLQPSMDTIMDVKTHMKRDRKTRRRQPSVDATVVVKRPEKRKAATFEHKETLQDLSTAEIEWARAVNCLPEKVEENKTLSETEDLWPGPNKRLILTSQCMQQLLPPPSASLLQADATTKYESVVYFVAKLGLEDAFSMACSYTCCHRVPQDKIDMMLEKLPTSEKPGDMNLSKVIGDFSNRTKKLEEDLIRLNKKASIGEVRVECKDLMRMVVDNCYAKMHTSEEAAMSENSVLNSFIQPYITELPMPSKLTKGIKYHPL